MSARRIVNALCAAMGLAVLWPIMAVLIVIVRLETPGPGIFAQTRVGKDGKEFTCYKVRTMSRDTPNAASHLVTTAQVTRSGRILRKIKLDELPQLWNVLVGDINLVGPRPCLPSQVELIEARRRLDVLTIRPGITGLAQIRGIDMSDPERLANVDAEYLRSRSFGGDLSILLKTVVGAGSGDRTRAV